MSGIPQAGEVFGRRFEMAIMAMRGPLRISLAAIVLAAVFLSCPAHSHEAGEPLPNPGYRPASPLADAFVDSLDSARIVVLPTVVRRTDRAAVSFASQQEIIASLNAHGTGLATGARKRIDLGPLRHEPQWTLFQASLAGIATALQGWEHDADYTLVMEVLLPPGNQVVFGIECYVFDREGRNAFSFLLNSHHQMFVDGELFTREDSEAARTEMIARATRVGLDALYAQIEFASECRARMKANPAEIVQAGVLLNFDTELPAGRDAYGIPLGYSTFSDGQSRVAISTTTDHPPRPGESVPNATLQLDLDVTGWAGVVYLVHDADLHTWRTQDWSAFDGFSFWLYGNASGTRLFVDVLDNRHPCSTRDDAERYTYEFTDDFSGWQQVTVHFSDMVRKEIGNDAPADGLGLGRVHGWGLGATATGGRRTWFIDDFVLWSDDESLD